jgi:hypothetical protein
MNHGTETLAQASNQLTGASLSSYRELLAQRRVALAALAARQELPGEVEELAAAWRCGRDARSRLLVELGALRAKIEDLRRLRAGLGRLRPIQTPPPSLDVRL